MSKIRKCSDFSALKSVPFPNSSDFGQCLKSEPFCSAFRCSVDQLDQPNIRISDVYSTVDVRKPNIRFEIVRFGSFGSLDCSVLTSLDHDIYIFYIYKTV